MKLKKYRLHAQYISLMQIRDDKFFFKNIKCYLQHCCGASRVPVSRSGRGRGLDPGSQEGEEALHHPAAAAPAAPGEGGGEGAREAEGETPATHLPA